MSDASQIHSLTADETLSSVEKDMLTFSETELRFLPDTNMNNYSSNVITFSTEQLRTVWWSFASSYLAIPIRITSLSGSTPFSAGSIVAFKQSVLDFISRIQVSTSSGQLLVSEDNIQLVNHIRLLVEKDIDWLMEEGNSLLMAKDVAETSLEPGIKQPVADASYNKGLKDRACLFKNSCREGETTTFSTVLTIPLKYLSDFFAKMDFPLINGSFDLQFEFNSRAFAPFSSSSSPYIVSIGQAYFPGSDVPINSCRLYYHAVKFTPTLNQKLVTALNKGMTKRVYFRVADTYLPKVPNVDKDMDRNAEFSKLVSASTVHPLRIWLLAHPTDSLTSPGLHVYPAGFKNGNVLINNDPLLKQALNTPQDWYNVLSQQMPGQGDQTGKGGLISYPEFLSAYRLHCFDCQRLGAGRLADPNAAVSIQVQATRDSTYSAGNCDHTIIVERLQGVSFHLDSSSIKVLVGLNA